MLVIFLFSNLPSNVFAVDGYKEFKFGMDQEQVLKSKFCHFKLPTNIGTKGVDAVECADFPFGEGNVEGAFFFIDKKLKRVAFEISIDQAVSVTKILTGKYSISKRSSEEEFKAVDLFPGRSAGYAFDDDTIFLTISSGHEMQQSAMLIYTAKDFDALVSKKQAGSLKGDL